MNIIIIIAFIGAWIGGYMVGYGMGKKSMIRKNKDWFNEKIRKR